jgi:hypothetical protein
MSSAELSEWMAFYAVEPFGGDTGYIGHAITASTIANANRGKGKAFKPADFMPQFDKQPQGIGEQMMIAEMFTAGLGGKDLRDG